MVNFGKHDWAKPSFLRDEEAAKQQSKSWSGWAMSLLRGKNNKNKEPNVNIGMGHHHKVSPTRSLRVKKVRIG